jgi:hypothetical protein
MVLPKIDVGLSHLQLLKLFDHDVIDRLLEGIASHAVSERKNLSTQANEIAKATDVSSDDKFFLQDALSDEVYFLEEVEKLSNELAIIALYKKMEITTKRAVSIAFPKVPTHSLFKVNHLKKSLLRQGVDITSLAHYRAMDEVRCLNNSIKHDGTVGTELAAYPAWKKKKGQPLMNLDVAYMRLAPKCAVYMQELLGELIKRRRANLVV